MPEEFVSLLSKKEREDKLKLLSQGEYRKVERQIYRKFQKQAADEIELLLNDFTLSSQGKQIASDLSARYGYSRLKLHYLNLTLAQGDTISVPSWYTTRLKKPIGRRKKGPRGRGTHPLLRYWGFIGKLSPDYVSRVVRSGAASASYDLAAKDLNQQGIKLVSRTVNNLTTKTGAQALNSRDKLMLEPNEDWSGKRIIIAIDGGRVRTRVNKRGPKKLQAKRVGYKTDWREPKVIAIAKLNKQGKKKTNTKPLYEATLGGADQVFELLTKLTTSCNLHQAKEIILTGDGAGWIWERYQKWHRRFRVKGKTTEILDWYHASEHLHELTKTCTTLTPKRQKIWYKRLKNLLIEGRYNKLRAEVVTASKKHNCPKLISYLDYFDTHRSRIHYHQYKANNQPLGSGIVESAVRRIVNLKLKSPSIFWKPDNLEKIMHLRCILLSDRWQTFIDNLVQASQLTLAPT
jgi:hypothetical protein